jgi:putative hydrolase of the HAD superfamily
MKKPKMILFDYGQTLLDEQPFDGIKGTQAVLENCVYNPNNITAQEVQNLADELNKDIGRYNPETGDLYSLEVHNHQFQKYLYEYFGLELKVSHNELEIVFWNAAAPAIPTKNIYKFLEYINDKNIRFGIISNISYSGEALKNRIHEFFPKVNFEFILATSEYIFRKPHKRIYELALRKAGLQPEDAWYCGDNAVCDVEGAKSAGIMPIWYTGAINENAVTPKSDCIIINDWLELIKILDDME